MKQWRSDKRKYFKVVSPLFFTSGMTYLSWVYSYYICWNEIYKHHSRSVGIGLIIGNILFILLLYLIWSLIVIIGPGRQPKLPLYRIWKDVDETGYKCIEPPEYFMCSPDGHPIWCSTCQSIKIDRSHHSTDVGYCVPRMDHYCSFLAAVIGKRNYRLFNQFCFWCICFFLYIGISMACYTKQYKERRGSVNPNIIVLFILCLLWIILINALFWSHCYYIYKNKTTLDDIGAKRNRRTNTTHDDFLSLLHNGTRYVLRLNLEKKQPWDKGFKANWLEIMGPSPIYWLSPFGKLPRTYNPLVESGDLSVNYDDLVGDFVEEISAPYLEVLHKRVEANDYIATT